MATGGARVNYILILWRWLRLYLNICMAHSLLIRWWRVSSTSSPWCELWAWISWAAVDAEFWLVTVVVIPPPMVHRDHWQYVVVMRVSQAGAALRALARVAAPHGDGDGGNDERDQQQWHDQVERVESSNHRLQPSRWTALPHIFLPESPLQQITKQIHMLKSVEDQKQAKTHHHGGYVARSCFQKSRVSWCPLHEYFLSGLVQHKGSGQQHPEQKRPHDCAHSSVTLLSGLTQ